MHQVILSEAKDLYWQGRFFASLSSDVVAIPTEFETAEDGKRPPFG